MIVSRFLTSLILLSVGIDANSTTFQSVRLGSSDLARPKEGEISGATRFYVRSDAGPGGDGSSWATALPTVSEALIVATTGADVWIAGGTYTEAVTLDVPLTLRGGLDPNETKGDVPVEAATPTVIDASGLSSSVVSIRSASEVELIGLTLTGGHAARGGGIHSQFVDPLFNKGVTIYNCRILDNTAEERGGGIYGARTDFTIEKSLIQGNLSKGIRTQDGGSSTIVEGLGGGILIEVNSSLTVTESVVRDNRCGVGGSGLEVRSSPNVTITVRDATFTENFTDFSSARCGVIQLPRETFANLEKTSLSNNRVEASPVSLTLNGAIFGAMTSDGPGAHLIDCDIIGNASMSGILLNEVDLEHCRINENDGAGVSALAGEMRGTEVSQNGGRGIVLPNGDLFDCVIAGNAFTGLTGGSRIVRCSIEGNGAVTVTQPGLPFTGGVNVSGGSITLADSTISRNRGGAFSAGGIDFSGVTALLRNCRMEGNRSQVGAGAGFFRDSKVALDGCEVVGNSTLQPLSLGANGISSSESSTSPHPTSLELTNTIVAGNLGTGRGGVYMDGGDLSLVNSTIQRNHIQTLSAGSLLILNSVIWNGTEGFSAFGFEPIDIRFSNVGQAPSGKGNIFEDPQFVRLWDGTSADLRLRCGSPSIDSGTTGGAPDRDFVGRSRPIGGGIDMGAYENCSRDLNGDLEEDGLDLLYFPSEWYRPVGETNAVFDLAPEPPSPARIDSLDLMELLEGDLSLQNGQK